MYCGANRVAHNRSVETLLLIYPFLDLSTNLTVGSGRPCIRDHGAQQWNSSAIHKKNMTGTLAYMHMNE